MGFFMAKLEEAEQYIDSLEREKEDAGFFMAKLAEAEQYIHSLVRETEDIKTEL